MSTSPQGGSNAKARRSRLNSEGHTASRVRTTKESGEVLQDDSDPVPGLAIPEKGPKWDPANEHWTRGVITILVVTSASLVVVMSAIALLLGRAAVQDLAVFLSVVLTPLSGALGYYYGRRSTIGARKY